MNLYEIMLQHYSPKDSKKGILTYLVAESDDHVYEWLKSDIKLPDGRWVDTGYLDKEEYEDDFKEITISLKGEMNDEGYELTDLYYGLTLFGWSLKKENISQQEIDIIKDAGVSLVVI